MAIQTQCQQVFRFITAAHALRLYVVDSQRLYLTLTFAEPTLPPVTHQYVIPSFLVHVKTPVKMAHRPKPHRKPVELRTPLSAMLGHFAAFRRLHLYG